MFYRHASESAYHNAIIKAARKTKRSDLIKDTYELSLATGQPDLRISPLCWLRHWYALHLCYDHNTKDDRTKAIGIWEMNLMATSRAYDGDLLEATTTSAHRLACLYYEEARDSGLDTPECRSYLDSLC